MSDEPPASADRSSLYRRLVQEAEDMLYMLDAEGRYQLVNDSFLKKTGYERSELVGETPAKLLSEADLQKGQRRVEELVAADERRAETYTVDLITKSGDTFPCEIRFTLLPPESGRYAGMVGVARDVSERQRRKQKLQVMTRVLRHNLRNKLSIVMGEAELLRTRALDGEPPSPTDIAETTETIESTANELIRLSEKVRTVQEGIRSQTDGPTRTDAAVIARSTVEKLRRRFPDAVINYEGPETAWASASTSLEVALQELIENGVQHYEGEGDPRVDVCLEETGETVGLIVTDRCPRVPDAERRVIRSEEETDLKHSAGVGLWLVYWVTKAADGRLDFDYTGDGNRIELCFESAEPL